MPPPIGQPLDALDSPQLLIDLDVVDANLKRMFGAFRERPVNVRVHFKSLKCGGLARYIAAAGAVTPVDARPEWGWAARPAWSPDGRFVFVGDGRDVVAVDVTTGALCELDLSGLRVSGGVGVRAAAFENPTPASQARCRMPANRWYQNAASARKSRIRTGSIDRHATARA